MTSDTLTKYINEARQAIEFRDKVRDATQDEQIAVGTDHINWIISIVERLANEKEERQ